MIQEVLLMVSVMLRLTESQVSVTVASFNNIGGSAFDRVANVSENALVGKQGIRVDSVEPNIGTATGGSHVHVRGEGFAVDTYGGQNKVDLYDNAIYRFLRFAPNIEQVAPNNNLNSWGRSVGTEELAWGEKRRKLMDELFVACDVIEGACTVDCGGARKIVCDTRSYEEYFDKNAWFQRDYMALFEHWAENAYEWKDGKSRSFYRYSWNPVCINDDGLETCGIPPKADFMRFGCDNIYCDGDASMSVLVTTKETSDHERGFDYWTGNKTDVFTIYNPYHADSPWLYSVKPRYGTAGDVFTLRGENLGTSLKDYRAIYVGPGRPPQGGNLESEANSALCRVEELNAAANLKGEVFGTLQPVTGTLRMLLEP